MADNDDSTAQERERERRRTARVLVQRSMLALTVMQDGQMAGHLIDAVKIYMPEDAARCAGEDADLLHEPIYAAIEEMRRQADPPFEELRIAHEGAVHLAVATLSAFGVPLEDVRARFRALPAMPERIREHFIDANEARELRIRRDVAIGEGRVDEAEAIDAELVRRFWASLPKTVRP
jgi:hypothetical protein